MNGTEVDLEISPIYSGGKVPDNGSSVAFNISYTLNQTLNIFSIIILFITMISLGCTMEIFKIKAHLFKPKGVAIALLAQFGIMPLTAFCLAKILHMGPVHAVTVLICGCCPGGTLSNIFSLALEGDMNLRCLTDSRYVGRLDSSFVGTTTRDTYLPVSVNLPLLIPSQHPDDSVLQRGRPGYDAPAALHLLQRIQRPGERCAVWQHHEKPCAHLGAVRHRHSH